jgi:hypothetical protein
LMAAVALVAASFASVVVSTRADAVPIPWKNCGTSGDPVQVTKFDASVWPPQRGMPETFNYSYIVGRDIDVARRTLTVSPPGHVPDKLLKFFLKGSHIAAGPYSSPPGGETFNVPKSIPPGTVFATHLSVVDRTGAQVFCLDMSVPIK